MRSFKWRAYGASVLVLAMLSGCGGGGGGVSSTPAPVAAPAPSPAPAPTPTPSPSVAFQTAEYNRATGLELASAATAYGAGASGRGVVAAVIDSGVNPGNAEFSGRISPASQDVSGTRGVGDDGGHGTAVSGVLLAAKNDSGIHGMAFEATLLALRTDTPGTCNAAGDCTHNDNAIARALDVAVAQGAKVANLSLGGSAANATLRNAIGRATASGMVIVMSAGNEGQSNPSDLALVATDGVARSQVIVVGSHGTGRALSSFSNRAGVTAQQFVTALGEEVRSFDENGQALLYSGTSFSAPFVAGAAALLAQAFPNLTGAQIVQLLLESADDLGAAGVDSVYGRGGLNIGRAFQPRGQTSLAGTAVPVNLAAEQATLSPAMGDAGARTGMGAIVLDGFNRAFAVDLAARVRNARPQSSLAGTLTRSSRGASLSAGATSVSVSIAQAPGRVTMQGLSLSSGDAVRARATAGLVAHRLSPRTSVALGFGHSGSSAAGQLAGHSSPAFLVARSSADALGFDRVGQSAASVRHRLGSIGLNATAERGDGLLYGPRPGARAAYQRSPYTLVGVGLDRRFGSLRVTGGLSRLQEDWTVLGARFGPLLGGGGAGSWFADAIVDWRFGSGWSIGAATRQGWTRMDAGGLVQDRVMLRSDAFSIDVAKAGLSGGGEVAFRLAQPLRVANGGIGVRLPVGYDYGSGAVAFANQRLDLSPSGRELVSELSYARLLFGGRIDANLFWRQDPGHYAAAPDDIGAAVRWRVGF